MADVHFCNLCDRSVPLADVQSGATVRLGDRLLCPDCHELIARASGRGRGGGGLALAGLVAALFGWAAVVAVWLLAAGRLDGVDSGLAELRGDLGGDLERSARAAAEQTASLGQDLALLGGELRALREAQELQGEDLRRELARLGSELDALTPLAGTVDQLGQRLARSEASVSVIEDRHTAFRANQEGLRDRVMRLEDQTKALAAAAPQAADSEFAPEVTALLRKLQDEDPEVRYGALEKLQAIQDERLLPSLYPLLGDPYEFTRFLAAHTFAEWDAKPAVPHLIEALLDEVAFVREAAVRALRRITGQNFGYQHDGDGDAARAARQVAYEQWKTWWSANGEAFLAGS